MVLLLRRRWESPLDKPCSVCQGKSQFGYSDHAEAEFGKIRPMCLPCLISQLQKDYASYGGRAVIVEPAEGPPVYVFHEAAKWSRAFEKSKIAEDVIRLLVGIQSKCHDCGQKASFLWVESNGLDDKSFIDTLDKGLTETLLPKNPSPASLCGGCAVRRTQRTLERKQLSYLEVAPPKGTADGFVIPMGY
jgi:hypothetical protein